jgi:hypothetical protein
MDFQIRGEISNRIHSPLFEMVNRQGTGHVSNINPSWNHEMSPDFIQTQREELPTTVTYHTKRHKMPETESHRTEMKQSQGMNNEEDYEPTTLLQDIEEIWHQKKGVSRKLFTKPSPPEVNVANYALPPPVSVVNGRQMLGDELQVPMGYGAKMADDTVTPQIELGPVAGGQQRLNATGQVPPSSGFGRAIGNTVSW